VGGKKRMRCVGRVKKAAENLILRVMKCQHKKAVNRVSEKILSIKVRIYNLNGSLAAFALRATHEPGRRKSGLVPKPRFGPFVI